MQLDPMYQSLEPPIILYYGWFCQVPDCDGYGGIVEKRDVKTDEEKGVYYAKRNSSNHDYERESQSKQGAGEKAERQLTYLPDLD
jgi:hypothetical protein